MYNLNKHRQIHFIIITNLVIREDTQDNYLLCVLSIVLEERNYCVRFTQEEIL